MPSLLTFIGSLLESRSSEPPGRRARSFAPERQLNQLKLAMSRLLEDCQEGGEKIARRVRLARDIEDLWLLRTDAYHQIARIHGEPAAKMRINSLIPQLQGRVRGVRILPV